MARQVLPILGGVVGAFFGVPQLGIALGSIVGAVVDPATSQGPKLGDLAVQRSNEGMPRAIIYGTATCTGYILDFGPAIKTKEVVSGEKGAPSSEQEVVYRNYAIAICEGPIAGILRVWENDKLVYDVRPGSLMLAESAKWKANKFFYAGTEDQLPDVFLELNVSGPGETPAYRGTAYMVVGLEDLTNSLGAIPQYRFEVTASGTTISVVSPYGSAPRGFHGLYVNGAVWHTYYAPDPDDETGPMRSLEVYSGDEFGFNLERVIPLSYALQTFRTSFTPIPCAGTAEATALRTRTASNGTDTYIEAINLETGVVVDILTYTKGALDYPYLSSQFATSAYDPMTNKYVMLGGNTTAQQTQAAVISGGSVLLCDALSGATPGPVGFYGGVVYAVTEDSGVLWLESRLAATGALLSAPVVGPAIGFGLIENTALYCSADGIYVCVPTVNGVGTKIFQVTTSWTLLHTIDVTGPFQAASCNFYGDGGTFVIGPGSSSWDYSIVNTALSGGSALLSEIVADLNDRCSIPSDDYDVSELTDVVQGLTLTGDYTAADAIDTLRSCYFFDKAEPGDKLYYPKRGKPVVTTLTFDNLIDVPDLSKRDQVAEVPKKVHLLFQNATAGYAPVKSTYERSTVDVKSIVETTIEVPVVLSMDEGQQMVHKQHKVLTADAQGEIKLTIPDSLIALTPSDAIGLSLRGQVRRLRIDECEWADGALALTLRTDRQSAYTSSLTGIPIPEPTLPPSTIVGDTTFVFADVPSRIDSEDDLHYLVAGVGSLPGWYGWMLQRSLDAGANYSNVEQFNVPDIIGSLVDAVPAASEDYTDILNTVRVQLFRDGQTLEDLTEVQFLSEGGAFLLEKSDGSYEVMQYRDANDEGDGIFALTMLHRGRLNSGASAHTAGARFVMLSSAHHITAQSAWIGQALTHRPVSLGDSPENASPQTDTYVGRSQIEWPVAYLTLARSGADVITATWTPRHRFGTDDAPVASINFQGYRVTLDDGVFPAVTFDTTSANFTYDASALGAPLTVSVSSLNRITGAGPASSESI